MTWPWHTPHLRQADPNALTELEDERGADRPADLGQTVLVGVVPDADQTTQRALRLRRPMRVGVGLLGVGDIAQQMRGTGLMPGEVVPSRGRPTVTARKYPRLGP